MDGRRIALGARMVLGLIFFIFGLNGFFHFLPQPVPPAAAANFFAAMGATGYFLPLLKGTEVIAGGLLLSNFFVPLALTILAPIILNIVLFHLFLDPGGIAVGAICAVLELYLASYYRSYFRPVLTVRA